jgi:catechol 1,2-dioxygenase
MIIERHEDVTPAALAVMQQTTDPRLREIMTSLVSHLHAFVRDVRLTEEEFEAATAILNEMGQATTDTHNEMVLMSGSLGVSTLVCLLNNGDHGATETQQNLLGPFWRMNSPRVDNGGSIVRSETPGPALFVAARVTDRHGGPVAGAEVDVWHSSPVGLYEHQDTGQAEMNLRGKFVTDDAALLVSDGEDGRLPHSDGHSRGPAAQSAAPPSLPAGAPAHPDLQRRLQDASLADLRQR